MKKLRLICALVFIALLVIFSSPVFALTYTVTTCADSGPGSLRQAILDANSQAGADMILFNIPTFEASHVSDYYWWSISPSIELPTITETVTIDGSSQPTTETYNNKFGPEIEIDGSYIGFLGTGLDIQTMNCVIKNIVINHYTYCMSLLNGGGNSILGCYIGTDVTGEVGLMEEPHNGIKISSSAYNKIGDGTEAGRNIVFSYITGIDITGTTAVSNEVLGNYVGINALGTKKIGYQTHGIHISSSYNRIGNGTAGGRNVISGFHDYGVHIDGATATNNMVIGNFIGTDATGTTTIEAGFWSDSAGVNISNNANNNYVGDGTAGGRNIIGGILRGVIAGGTSNYVLGNYIGTDVSGTYSISNATGVVLSGNNNYVGNGTTSGRNILSGNLTGIRVGGSDNKVLGNYIGTTPNGLGALPNTSLAGVYLYGANSCIVGDGTVGGRNVISGNDTHGIWIREATSNEVLGNYIGVDTTGTSALPNSENGVYLFVGAYNNMIGNTSASERNIVSGNGINGIAMSSDSNYAVGNIVGLNAAGTAAIPNTTNGIWIHSDNNVVGGATPEARNIISGNSQNGIYIKSHILGNNLVIGNYIGTDINGTNEIQNLMSGIYINNATNSIIGDGSSAGENRIWWNKLSGISIEGSEAKYNSILRNSFSSNEGLGINLLSGANEGIFYPTIEAASYYTGASKLLSYGKAPASSKIDIYISENDPSGYGEGKIFLGTATADAFGDWAAFLTTTPTTGIVTALSRDNDGNSSEFALNKNIVAYSGDPLIVATTKDAVVGSLRQAIVNANTLPGHDTITFNIPPEESTSQSGTTWWSIKTSTPLPSITEAVTIDASTQTDLNPYGPDVEIDGNYIGSEGLTITTSNCAIKGLAINRFTGNGILLSEGYNFITNCYIGTNVTGEVDMGNTSNGILIDGGSDNIIKDNVISGNDENGIRAQVDISSWRPSRNLIIGNFIGTNKNAVKAIPNGQSGIYFIGDCRNNYIGDGTPTGRNIISGNGQNGILLSSVSLYENWICGNYIGTDYLGTSAIPNSLNGVFLYKTKKVLIGNVSPESRNIISGNSNNGIRLQSNTGESNDTNNSVLNNFIGIDSTGTSVLSNESSGIYIFDGVGNYIGNGSADGINIISGNAESGIKIEGSNSKRNRIFGNYIGLGPNGTEGFGNNFHGIHIVSGPSSNITNIIGNSTAEVKNVISGNTFHGIKLEGSKNNYIMGNVIGLGTLEATDMGNGQDGIFLSNGSQSNIIGQKGFVNSNKIFWNGRNGIGVDGATTKYNAFYSNSISSNDAAGIDITGGANEGAYPPHITDAVYYPVSGDYLIKGTSEMISYYESYVEVFKSSGDPGGSGEGVLFLGSKEADGGEWSIHFNDMSHISSITATSTNYNKNTSMFSINAPVISYEGDPLIVTTTHDAGKGSLRNAIEYANIKPGFDIISFNIPNDQATFDNGIYYWSIKINSDTLSVTDPVKIDGTTQPTNETYNNPLGPVIELDGGNNSFTGIGVSTGSSEIRSLAINRFDIGITLYSPYNKILGCYIGTDVTGTEKKGNFGAGIFLWMGAHHNLIGDGTPSGRNIISGNNKYGVKLYAWYYSLGGFWYEANNNTIIGNYVGTDRTGTQNLGNDLSGIYIEDCLNNNIGNGSISGQNLICYNGSDGISVEGSHAEYNSILYNSIFSNEGIGINLIDGANNGISSPSIITAFKLVSSNTAQVTGEAPASSIIEIYISDNDPSDYGEGKYFIGSTESDVNGKWSATLLNQISLEVTDRLCATATDQNGDTSEFSRNIDVTPNYSCEYYNPSLGLTISVPDGATNEAVTIEAAAVASPEAAGRAFIIAGQAINITSNVTQFSLPVTITLEKHNVPNATGYTVLWWTGTEWSSSGINIVSVTDTTITFTTTHLTVFAPFGIRGKGPVTFGPNPFDPDSDSKAVFNYILSENEDTKIYIVDLSGTIVWKRSFSAGAMGGRKGENVVEWDGTTDFGHEIGDGVYLYKIIQGNRVEEGGKIAIIRQ